LANEFDIQPKGLDKIPEPALKKDLVGDKDKNPAEVPQVEYSWADVMNILKYQLRRNLLMVLGKEPKTLSFWLETVIIILGVLALSVAVLFPKLGII
jgi:hypothetical protein